MDVALTVGPGENQDRFYRAVASRDRRFEGRFVVAVTTTGVYCRPGCPAPLPRRRNTRFYTCAAAAEEAGFRACLRCRPDASPGSPAWLGTSATVARGLGLIAAGVLDEAGVDGLASRLGVGARHLRRLFARELGASPLTVARTRRSHFARKLLEESELSIAQVALCAGYASVRRFNAEVLEVFRRAPRELRRGSAVQAGRPLTLRLPYKPPFEWTQLTAWVGEREIAGVERVEGGVYRRSVEIGGVAGVIEVRALDGEPALSLTVRAPVGRELLSIVEGVQRLFDLRADPLAIAARLERSPRLRALVLARPGLRVPGAFDPFETAVRAILGQQISVKGASNLCGRLVERFGRRVDLGDGLTHLFPSPSVIAEADVRSLGMPNARAEAIRGLARAIASGALDLAHGSVEALLELPGIGPWTASYVAMRAFGDPDAFPAGDLGLRKAWARGRALPTERALEAASQEFRPFRAYAALHLWTSLNVGGG